MIQAPSLRLSEAVPFPHTVMDGFLDRASVRAIHAEWPMDRSLWKHHQHAHSDKWACARWESFGPATTALMAGLNGADFLHQLAAATDIADLSADRSLFGGGLHETFRGGFLGIHADFNMHPESRLYRRLNLLIFLNEASSPDWNDALELWSMDGESRVRIAPEAGRAVLFATSARSLHGHPLPLTCPPDRSRRSIALYYYSAASPDPNPVEHSTLYRGQPLANAGRGQP